MRRALRIHIGSGHIDVLVEPLAGPATQAHLLLTRGGTTMADGQITVDTQNERLAVEFADDHGNTTAAPDGAAASYTTSDPAIVTITADPSDPLKGDIVPAGTAGTVDVGVTFNGTAHGPDGSPLADPAPVSLQVDPGAATGERIKLVSA